VKLNGSEKSFVVRQWGKWGGSYGKFPGEDYHQHHPMFITLSHILNLPTFEVASVRLSVFDQYRTHIRVRIDYLFNVVDFPDEGLPTRAMRGSRGILSCFHIKAIEILK
jgi:hypothetical protein